MNKFTVKHEINCNVETFWKTFFEKDFNDKLYLQHLGFPEFKVLDQKETETHITRKTSGKPKMNMPGPVAKILGDNFRYTEEGNFDKKSQTFQWKMIPSVMPDKIRTEGVVRIESIGDNKVRRIADLTVEAKIFGVGGLMESSAEKQLRQGWDDSAVFMNKYLASAAK
jgi:hypothetical protein